MNRTSALLLAGATLALGACAPGEDSEEFTFTPATFACEPDIGITLCTGPGNAKHRDGERIPRFHCQADFTAGCLDCLTNQGSLQ